MTVLDKLADYARQRTEAEKRKIPLTELKYQAEQLHIKSFGFENALKIEGISFICECKKASPSKGIIAPDFPYLDIAMDYERAGLLILLSSTAARARSI